MSTVIISRPRMSLLSAKALDMCSKTSLEVKPVKLKQSRNGQTNYIMQLYWDVEPGQSWPHKVPTSLWNSEKRSNSTRAWWQKFLLTHAFFHWLKIVRVGNECWSIIYTRLVFFNNEVLFVRYLTCSDIYSYQ